jgi:hypothetical protein
VIVIPHWLAALGALLLLLGFIGFAFRQGLKVKPDRNPDNWPPGTGSQPGDGASHGFDGHS